MEIFGLLLFGQSYWVLAGCNLGGLSGLFCQLLVPFVMTCWTVAGSSPVRVFLSLFSTIGKNKNIASHPKSRNT